MEKYPDTQSSLSKSKNDLLQEVESCLSTAL